MIFGGSIKTHLLAFFPADDTKYKEYIESLNPIGKDYRGKVLYTIYNACMYYILSIAYCSSY